MSSKWALGFILLIVLTLTSAREDAELEVTTAGVLNDTYADSNGEEEVHSELEEPSETTTEMPSEPGTLKLLIMMV